jgi:hypothetical protein
MTDEVAYDGLPATFADACRKADAAARKRTLIAHPRHVVAQSTIDATEFLVRRGDPERLHAWLAKHSAEERAAIRKHFESKKEAL